MIADSESQKNDLNQPLALQVRLLCRIQADTTNQFPTRKQSRITWFF